MSLTEVGETLAQLGGAVLLVVGVFLILPLGYALVVLGAMLLTAGVLSEVRGGLRRGARKAVQPIDDFS